MNPVVLKVRGCVQPGLWLQFPDPDYKRQVELILTSARSQLFEAGAALDIYVATASTEDLAEARKRRELARRGLGDPALPVAIQLAARRVAAKAFVHACVRAAKVSASLREVSGVPTGALDVLDRIEQLLAALVPVRDGVEHVDERLQGKARGKAYAPTGALSLWVDNLVGDGLSTTDQRGQVATVGVSEQYLTSLWDLHAELLMTFRWEGPAIRLPA